MAGANSTTTKSSKAEQSLFGFSGWTSNLILAVGNRRFPTMPARHGKLIGQWISNEPMPAEGEITGDKSAAINRREFGKRMGELVVGATFVTSKVSLRTPKNRITYPS
jgi:hypothetical protein